MVFRGYIQHESIGPDASFDEYSQKNSLFPGKTTSRYALVNRETQQFVATASKNNFADFSQQSPLRKEVVVESCRDDQHTNYLRTVSSERIWEVSGLTNEAGQSKLLSLEMLRSIFSEAYNNGKKEIFSGLLFAARFEILQYIYGHENMVRMVNDITVQDYFGNKDFPSKARLVPFMVKVDAFSSNLIQSIQCLSVQVANERQPYDMVELVRGLLKSEPNSDINGNLEYAQLLAQTRYLFFMSHFVRERIPEEDNEIIEQWINV